MLSRVLVYIAMFALPAFAEMKNELDDFREVPWGLMAPQSNKNQWRLMETFPLAGPFQKIYVRKNEKYYLGDGTIDRVAYYFHRALGFFHVEIMAMGQENYELIRKTCIENWGKPDNDVREINKKEGYDTQDTYWVGQRVTAKLSGRKYAMSGQYYIQVDIYLNEYSRQMKMDLNEMSQRNKGF